MKIWFHSFFILISLFLTTSMQADQNNPSPPSPLEFSLSNWSAKLYPHGLKIYGTRPPESKEYLLGKGLDDQFLDPEIIEKSDQSATLFYPSQNLKIKVSVVKNRLHFKFNSLLEQTMIWPILGEGEKTKAIIYPEGEGL